MSLFPAPSPPLLAEISSHLMVLAFEQHKWHEVVEIATKTLSIPRTLENSSLFARILATRGFALNQLAHGEPANGYNRQAVIDCIAGSYMTEIPDILVPLNMTAGRASLALNEFTTARECVQRVRALYRTRRDDLLSDFNEGNAEILMTNIDVAELRFKSASQPTIYPPLDEVASFLETFQNSDPNPHDLPTPSTTASWRNW